MSTQAALEKSYGNWTGHTVLAVSYSGVTYTDRHNAQRLAYHQEEACNVR
jgi:hypothetical protein